MIKLNRPAKPLKLTDSLQSQLTKEFKLTRKSVWNRPFIKKALLQMSDGKCCYCEMNITEESKYLEVEHFYSKSKYCERVMDWENLLPACKHCNGAKSNHDVSIEPILNPVVNDPQKHLSYLNYRIRPRDLLGRLTISVLNLNDATRLVISRYNIGQAIDDKIDLMWNELQNVSVSTDLTTLNKNSFLKTLKSVLKEGLPASQYAATTASVILQNPDYELIKNKLDLIGLWDADLQELESKIRAIALDPS